MQPATPRTVTLVVEYDGTRYAGFQLQTNALTIQGELEQAIAQLTLAPARVHGAGRTDSGVHAQGQVVAFATSSLLPCETLARGLNHFLPQDIAVRAAYNVVPTFDPRRHACSRVYQYTLLSHSSRSPLRERYAYRVTDPLDDEAMRIALQSLEGEHDFAPLGGPVAPGKSTMRNVLATRLWREDDLVLFQVEANAFLPHQMRRIGGLLVAVGTGRLSLEGVRAMMDGHYDPWSLGKVSTLPPQGLCLMKVNYEDFPPHGYETNENL